MSLIKQSDVKNHLSPRYRTKIHLCQPVSQPDATGYSVGEPDIIKANPSNFAADFVAEHSSPGVAATPGGSFARFLSPRGAYSREKRASVKPHSVFLRKECILPDRLDPLREPVGENWTLVEEITAPVFDTMIRQMGWHFEWVDRPCRRRGFGLTEEDAARRALARALRGVARRFNAAELVTVQAKKVLGFHTAHVTLQPRQIQQYTWLEIAENWHQFVVPVR